MQEDKRPLLFPLLLSGSGLPEAVEGFINHFNNLRSINPKRAQEELIATIEEGLRRGGRTAMFFYALDQHLVALGKLLPRDQRKVPLIEEVPVEAGEQEGEEAW